MNISQRAYYALGLILFAGLIYVAYDYMSRNDGAGSPLTATSTEQGGTTTPTGKPVTGGTKPSGSQTPMYSYANAEYKFQMKYPTYAQVQNGFSTFHALGNNWRLYAPAQAQGKNVVAFTVFKKDDGSIAPGKSFPLFFTSEVRVGVSNNVAECYTPDAGFPNQKGVDVTINGIKFKRFDFNDAGMQQYVQGSSYRTIYKNQCFAIEAVRNGSSYKDETMTAGIAQTSLDNYHAIAESIVRTFVFTK